MNKLSQIPSGSQSRPILLVMDGGPSVEIPGARVFDTSDFGPRNVFNNPASLDHLGKLMRGMDRVVVSCLAERRSLWVPLLRNAGVRGEIVCDPHGDSGDYFVGRSEDQAFQAAVNGPLAAHALIAKRAIDLAISIPLLLLLSPLLFVVALAIKLEDGGPVLFVQRRVGQHNRMFEMFKFRSMDPFRCDPDGELSTSRDDDRVTKVGRFIRRTSIDELPQLINVIRSEMSLVGPRPHALGSQAADKLFWEVDGAYWQRHSLKPGLTGLAQVRGHRGAVETEADLIARLEADLEYIRSWSVMKDLRILLSTVRVLLRADAY